MRRTHTGTHTPSSLTERERERERVRVTAVSSKSDRKEKYLPRAVSCSNGVESKLNEIQVSTDTNMQAVVIIVPRKQRNYPCIHESLNM